MTYLPFGTSGLLLLLLSALVRRGRPDRRLAVGAVGLFLWTWPPVATLFCGSLEWRYPIRRLPSADADVIVVPGGNLYTSDASEPETLPGYSTFLRCHYAAWLYRNWKQVPILASGGPEPGAGEPVADVMARALEEDGVPRSMIWTERAARSTDENALYAAQLLRGKGIERLVLVTESYHMRRAEACFRKRGVTVIPAPFAYRTLLFHARWRQIFPSANALLFNEDSLHEWVALAWYCLSGKI